MQSRKERLPIIWPKLRNQVRKRAGHQCEAILADGTRCREPGTDVDHIVRGDNHDISNLQLLCSFHHKLKTAAEGNSAQAGNRITSKHPGEANPSGMKLY